MEISNCRSVMAGTLATVLRWRRGFFIWCRMPEGIQHGTRFAQILHSPTKFHLNCCLMLWYLILSCYDMELWDRTLYPWDSPWGVRICLFANCCFRLQCRSRCRVHGKWQDGSWLILSPPFCSLLTAPTTIWAFTSDCSTKSSLFQCKPSGIIGFRFPLKSEEDGLMHLNDDCNSNYDYGYGYNYNCSLITDHWSLKKQTWKTR